MQKQIIKTQRDRKIMAFLNRGLVATSDQLNQLFFHSPVACRRRLVAMWRMGWLQRERGDETLPYVYSHVASLTPQIVETDTSFDWETSKACKGVFTTHFLLELLKTNATLVLAQGHQSLSSTVADLVVILEVEGCRILLVCDLLNRDGNGARHNAFFNNSYVLERYCKEYNVQKTAQVIFAERVVQENGAFFIKRPAHFHCADYQKLDLTFEMTRLAASLKYLAKSGN